jgi:hypothetical protein
MTDTTFAVEITFTAVIPAERLTEMVGEELDSEGWRENAGHAAEQWARENLPDAVKLAGEPDVGWLW